MDIRELIAYKVEEAACVDNHKTMGFMDLTMFAKLYRFDTTAAWVFADSLPTVTFHKLVEVVGGFKTEQGALNEYHAALETDKTEPRFTTTDPTA